MSVDLREAFHRAAEAVPMGDAERAVRSGRRRRRSATAAAPLAVLALVGGVWLVGAGSPGEDDPPVADSSPSPVTAADLAGRAFVDTGGPEDDAAVMLMFGGTELTVTVAQGSNTADYRIDDGVLVLEPTTFVCGGPGCRSDLPDLLYSRPTVTLAGAELTLTDAERTVTMTESDVAEPQPDAALTGWTWVLESYSGGGEPPESVAVPEGVRSTLDFGNGAVGVNFGCNTGGGDVIVTDSTIEISLATTQVGCAPPVLSVEQAVWRVLWNDPLTYVIEGDRLTLTGARGELVYRATS